MIEWMPTATFFSSGDIVSSLLISLYKGNFLISNTRKWQQHVCTNMHTCKHACTHRLYFYIYVPNRRNVMNCKLAGYWYGFSLVFVYLQCTDVVCNMQMVATWYCNSTLLFTVMCLQSPLWMNYHINLSLITWIIVAIIIIIYVRFIQMIFWHCMSDLSPNKL